MAGFRASPLYFCTGPSSNRRSLLGPHKTYSGKPPLRPEARTTDRYVDPGALITNAANNQTSSQPVDTVSDPSKGVIAQRPWCAYPAVARYSGQGDRADAASYACTAPAK